MSSVAAELTISGMVQGVGYRYYCYHNAFKLNLSGWVKNNPDGSVIVFVEGERGEIEILIDELKTGPPAASVRDVNVRWMEFTGKYNRFDIAI